MRKFLITLGLVFSLTLIIFVGTSFRFQTTDELPVSDQSKEIQLQSIEGTYDFNMNTVKFQWVSSFEDQSKYFMLQRSEDMEAFEDICMVKAAGHSAAFNHYQCADVMPLKGLSYYRLKQVNLDQSEWYSETISIQVIYPSDESVSYIIPNPNDGLFRLLIPVDYQKIAVSILDEMGQTVKSLSISNDQPNFYLSLDLRKSLAKGKYYVVMEASSEQHIKTMQVVEKWEEKN